VEGTRRETWEDSATRPATARMAIPPAAAVPLMKFLRDKTCERDGLLSTLLVGPAKIILRKIQR